MLTNFPLIPVANKQKIYNIQEEPGNRAQKKKKQINQVALNT